MSTRARRILIILGLIIISCALLALGYVLWPLTSSTLQGTLAPTFLTPP